MLLTWMLNDLTVAKPDADDQTILLLLDEFPLLRAPIIEQKLATARKYRIVSVLLAQTLSQIRAVYGPNESISGVCDVQVLFPTLDEQTRRHASSVCGQSTVWTENVSRDSAGRRARSVHETARPLLYPHELAELKNRVVIYKKGEPVILGRSLSPSWLRRLMHRQR
jgi:type IV secretory pathway TraG/TraD family ATPase VirD4